MADEWGGEPVQPVAAFQDQYGTWVARFVIGGVPVLVFSEGDAPPELAAYPDDGSAVLAYQRHYRVDVDLECGVGRWLTGTRGRRRSR